MKRNISVLVSVMLLLMLVIPASVTAQDDAAEVTLFVTEDGAYSVALLDGWAATGSEDEGLSVANSQEALDKFDTDVDPSEGDLAIGLLAVPSELVAQLGLDEEATFVELLEAFLPIALGDSEEPVEVSDVQELDLAGRPAAYATVTSDTVEAAYALYALAPDTIGIGFLGGAPGVIEEQGDLALQILATARYSQPLVETFDDDALAFNYPEEWLAQGESGIYTITNDQEALSVDVLSEGQFGILAFDLGLLGYTGESVSDVATQLAALIQEEGQEYSDPIEVEVGDNIVGIIDMTTPDTDGNEGGIMVIQSGDELFGVVFLTADSEAYQVGLLALNVLLSME